MCDDRPACCRDAQLGQGVSEVVGTLLCLSICSMHSV